MLCCGGGSRHSENYLERADNVAIERALIGERAASTSGGVGSSAGLALELSFVAFPTLKKK